MSDIEYSDELVERVIWRRGRLHPFETIEAAKTALIVVDLQNAFMAHGAPLEIPAARDIIPQVNQLARAVRRTGGKVIFLRMIQGPDKGHYWKILNEYVLSPDKGERASKALFEDAEGSALWPDLEVEDSDLIVTKNRFSGFCGTDGRLAALLREHSLDTVLITGTVTNVCCESTAREAAMHDFKTIMISDGNASRSEQDDHRAYAAFIDAFGDVRTSVDVIEMLQTDKQLAAAE
jgi:ureidoacrylate peracid hydrolase